MSAPVENIAAVIEKPGARITVKIRPIPTPGADEILVRNRAVAANPADWKIQDKGYFVTEWPNVLGSDVSGEVVEVGSGVTRFKKGDRVLGFGATIYNSKIDHGAWQTYTVVREIAASKIPDVMSFEDASVFPMAVATAAVALFTDLAIPRNGVKGEGILIWGAGSSVGVTGVQLAKALGFTVFATASVKHHAWLKSLGADHVFDYSKTDVVDRIVDAAKATGKPIKLGFDSIGHGETQRLVSETVKKSAGEGKVATTSPLPEGQRPPAGVDVLLTLAMRAGKDQSEMGAWLFNEWLAKLLEDKAVVPAPPVEIVDGGIQATQQVFDKLKAGVSGKKLVVKVE